MDKEESEITSAREWSMRRTSDRTLSRTSWKAPWCHWGWPGSRRKAWGADSDWNTSRLSAKTKACNIGVRFDLAAMAAARWENQVNKKEMGIGGEECENYYWLNLDLGMAGSARWDSERGSHTERSKEKKMLNYINFSKLSLYLSVISVTTLEPWLGRRS